MANSRQSRRQSSNTSSSRSIKPNQSRRRSRTASVPASSRSRKSSTPLTSRSAASRRQIGSRQSTATNSIRENIAQDDQEDGLEHIVMAVDKIGKDTIGCAYYVARDGVLRCMEDMHDVQESILDTLKLDIQPTIILLSSRIDHMFDLDVTRSDRIDSDDTDRPVLPYKRELRPSPEFRYDQGVQKLASISSLIAMPGVKYLVPGDDETYDETTYQDEIGFSNERGQVLHLSSMINLEAKISVGCAGAIVSYLQRRGITHRMSNTMVAEDVNRVLKLEMFSLGNHMLVNADTLAALQILQPESHPNAVKQGPGTSGSKESLSVYGLFYRFAKTPHGRARLRQIFLHPSLDTEIITRRHDSVGILARSDNSAAIQILSKNLSKMKDMRRTMAMLQRGIEGGTIKSTGVKSSVWSSLLDFCCYVEDLSAALKEVNGFASMSISRDLLEILTRSEFRDLGQIIYDVVDLNESIAERRTVIKRNIDLELDTVKDLYNNMDTILQQKAIATAAELRTNEKSPVPNLTVMYYPQFGYLVQLPSEVAEEMTEKNTPSGWQRSFVADGCSYYKTAAMYEMDKDLGDVWSTICDKEIDISYDLAQKVLEQSQLFTRASELCGELDCLLALAHGAAEYRLRRPHMVEENVIDIRGGRHILQELLVPSYIANDTLVSGGNFDDDESDRGDSKREHPSTLLLTGPNFSGKSVYLKQVALIVYMAQVGSFVPAEYARLGLTDKILTRVTARETVSKGQSSFMIDLQQLTWAVNASTSRTLLIIDEFGKGTDICDGAGLMAGLVKYLCSQNSTAPKTIACTHFHEIFEHGFVAEEEPGLCLLQMEVCLAGDRLVSIDSESTCNEEVVYLYKVQPGRSTLAYGTQCAAMNGIPEVIVARACQLTQAILRGDDLVTTCSGVTSAEYEELKEAEAVSRAFLGLDLSDLDLITNDLKRALTNLFTDGS